MATVRQLITGSVKLLGVLRKGEALSPDEAMDGLNSLNEMIDSWANNSLLAVARTWESFNIGGGTTYTIGAGGDLNTVRPIAIRASFIRTSQIDYTLEYISDEQYESIPYKTIATTVPQFFSYDNGYPLGKIRLYPAMSGTGQLHILSEKQITKFSSLDDNVDFPPGWARALRYSLALELAPEYEVEPSALLIANTQRAYSDITLGIAKNRPIKSKPQPYKRNIYSGWYV